MDTDVILVLSNREMHTRFSRFVKPSSVSKHSYTILSAMGDWFRYTPSADEIDWPLFTSWFCLVRHAKLPSEEMEVYRELLDKLQEAPDPDPDEVKPLLEGLTTRDYAAKIAERALRITDGDFSCSFMEIASLVEERNSAIGKVDDVGTSVITPTLEGMESVSAPGITWRLPELNDALGDLRKGDFIVIGKRPDAGGTTLLASETTHMAPQLGEKRVLWVNNEEAGNKVLRRVVQSAIGWSTAKIELDLPGALDEYARLMGCPDKILLFNKADASTYDVDTLLKKYDIGLIVFDQLWKVHGFAKEATNEVGRQTMLFNWARELAKMYAPVITVHQADGSAEGKRWIDMSMLYGSKTGIQGEADAIITLGRDPDEGDMRYLYVPKNKLAGKVPALRNGRFEIKIEPEFARFKSFRT